VAFANLIKSLFMSAVPTGDQTDTAADIHAISDFPVPDLATLAATAEGSIAT
jgi:hypothetical protein